MAKVTLPAAPTRALHSKSKQRAVGMCVGFALVPTALKCSSSSTLFVFMRRTPCHPTLLLEPQSACNRWPRAYGVVRAKAQQQLNLVPPPPSPTHTFQRSSPI